MPFPLILITDCDYFETQPGIRNTTKVFVCISVCAQRVLNCNVPDISCHQWFCTSKELHLALLHLLIQGFLGVDQVGHQLVGWLLHLLKTCKQLQAGDATSFSKQFHIEQKLQR